MKKVVLTMAALALCAGLLAGCGLGSLIPGGGDEVFTVPDENAAASMDESLARPADEPAAGIQLNDELLAFIGQTVAEAREYWNEEQVLSFINYDNGVGGIDTRPLGLPERVTFEVTGTPEQHIAAVEAYVATGEKMGDGDVDGNVFSDDMTILAITAANQAVPACFFVPGAELTRTSLNEFFGQEPEMEYQEPYPGMEYDSWNCHYTYDGYTIKLYYIEEGDDYIPVGAAAWAGDRDAARRSRVNLDMSPWAHAIAPLE